MIVFLSFFKMLNWIIPNDHWPWLMTYNDLCYYRKAPQFCLQCASLPCLGTFWFTKLDSARFRFFVEVVRGFLMEPLTFDIHFIYFPMNRTFWSWAPTSRHVNGKFVFLVLQFCNRHDLSDPTKNYGRFSLHNFCHGLCSSNGAVEVLYARNERKRHIRSRNNGCRWL